MAIDTNTLTLGSSMPAKNNPAVRADTPSADASQGSQANSAGASGPEPASTTPGGANEQSGNTKAGTAAGQKTAGPSAQTRSNARPARARANAANSAPSQAGTDAPDAATETGRDFGSVMASALVRGAAGTSQVAAPVTTASGNTNSATTSAPAQPAAGTPTDAVGWFAQAFLPSAPLTQAVAAAPAAVDAADAAGGAINSVAGGADAQTPRALAAQLATQLATQNGLTGAKSPGNAATAQVDAAAASQTQAVPTSNAALPAAAAVPAGGLNALADVQKLIAGLTGANPTDSDTDPDADAATPKTHAAPDSDGTDTAQAAAALQAASLTRANGNLGAATLTVHAPVGSAAFADEVSAKAAGLAQSGITQAQLQLNPADMGPVQVHITMQAGQASVWFGATHADTRAALEQSLPRLRELFAGAGMPLTDSGVFREPPQQQQAPSLPAPGSSAAALSDTAVVPTVTQVANIRLALLDTYA